MEAEIEHHEFQKIGGGGCRKDLSLEAMLHKLWQQTGMVDMRMSQNDIFDICGIERKRIEIELTNRSIALEHAAIDQKSGLICPHKRAGTRNRSRRTIKRNCRHWLFPDSHAPA